MLSLRALDTIPTCFIYMQVLFEKFIYKYSAAKTFAFLLDRGFYSDF